MIQRCTNPNAPNYYLYGSRGITVCDRWLHSFESFLADLGERPQGKTLDRFPDGDGNYEPGNARWATLSEQNLNRRDREGRDKGWVTRRRRQAFREDVRSVITEWVVERKAVAA
jgi:hypothetical protein